jgi:hypothetical protein
MMFDQINMDGAKKYWPWVLGGIVGLYLVSKYYGGNSETGYNGQTVLGYNSEAAAQAQSARAQDFMMQTQANREMAETENQRLEISTAAQSAYTQSQSHMVLAVIESAVQLAAAQSLIPIAAINAASVSNQAALMAGADVASSANNAFADILRSEAIVVASQSSATADGAAASAKMASDIKITSIQANRDIQLSFQNGFWRSVHG